MLLLTLLTALERTLAPGSRFASSLSLSLLRPCCSSYLSLHCFWHCCWSWQSYRWLPWQCLRHCENSALGLCYLLIHPSCCLPACLPLACISHHNGFDTAVSYNDHAGNAAGTSDGSLSINALGRDWLTCQYFRLHAFPFLPHAAASTVSHFDDQIAHPGTLCGIRLVPSVNTRNKLTLFFFC